MKSDIEIVRLTELPPELTILADEAEREGHRFLRRLREEWQSGANRFDAQGEALFGVKVRGRLVGIGGLNRDPYAGDPGAGRIRHFYVLEAFRRRGLARVLMERLVALAGESFRRLRLRTDNEEAARFYERAGFLRITRGSATHAMALERHESP